MRTLIFLFGFLLIAGTGCQVIPTDMFPKVKWYWSQEARQYRQDKQNHYPQKHQ